MDAQYEHVKWDSMDWAVAVQNLAISENDERRMEAATRVYIDLGADELGFGVDDWKCTFASYNWDGDETLEQARLIFGGQK